MKKIVFVFLFLASAISVKAQSEIYFKLNSDGEFYINENKVDTVLDFPGQSAQQLYSKVKSSLLKVYNNPDVVMSENEPVSLSVFSLVEDWCTVNPTLSGWVWYSSNYTLLFHFKDGRIKIDAPKVNDELLYHGYSAPFITSFHTLIQKWCKDERTYKKHKDKIGVIEAAVNIAILQVAKDLIQNTTEEAEDW